MPYTYISLAQARTQLASRLYDPNNKFWSDLEKNAYLIEALRTWNAYSNFWRAEFTLDPVDGTVWYDITDLAVAPNSLRPQTVLDSDIYKLIQYHFLEPATGATWTGSTQFTAADLRNALQRRRDEILSGAGSHITRALYPAVPGRTFMADTVIDVRRVAWIPVEDFGYVNSPLWKDDNFALESYENDYTTREPGTPSTYQQSAQPPLSFDTDIAPAVPGEYEVLSVNAGANLNAAGGEVINLPNDFTWVAKFGAMADLLNRDSNARDVNRARYCNLRYAQGMAMLARSAVVISGRINNLPLGVDSAQNTDNYRIGWQGETAGIPELIITAGLNMIGLAPTPDDSAISITLSVVQNAPIPEDDSDKVQVGRDELDVILDYAVHLASFKMGGTEFVATIPLFQRFLKQASLFNSKLVETGEYADIMAQLSQLQAESNPVFATVDATDAKGEV